MRLVKSISVVLFIIIVTIFTSTIGFFIHKNYVSHIKFTSIFGSSTEGKSKSDITRPIDKEIIIATVDDDSLVVPHEISNVGANEVLSPYTKLNKFNGFIKLIGNPQIDESGNVSADYLKFLHIDKTQIEYDNLKFTENADGTIKDITANALNLTTIYPAPPTINDMFHAKVIGDSSFANLQITATYPTDKDFILFDNKFANIKLTDNILNGGNSFSAFISDLILDSILKYDNSQTKDFLEKIFSNHLSYPVEIAHLEGSFADNTVTIEDLSVKATGYDILKISDLSFNIARETSENGIKFINIKDILVGSPELNFYIDESQELNGSFADNINPIVTSINQKAALIDAYLKGINLSNITNIKLSNASISEGIINVYKKDDEVPQTSKTRPMIMQMYEYGKPLILNYVTFFDAISANAQVVAGIQPSVSMPSILDYQQLP